MSAFSDMLEKIHNTDPFGRSVTVTIGGVPSTVTAVPVEPDYALRIQGAPFIAKGRIYEFMLSDIAGIAEGDTITDGGDTFTVAGEPREDADAITAIVWAAEQ